MNSKPSYWTDAVFKEFMVLVLEVAMLDESG